jgi:ribosomal protein L11 methyltransferase
MKYYEVHFTISCPNELLQDVCDVVAALGGEAGFETFEPTTDGMKGYVQQALFSTEMLDAALQQLPFHDVSVSYTVAEADDRDWNATWEEEGFEPIYVGNQLAIHDGVHLPYPTDNDADRLQVEIDAKLAFGTGNHATTRMMCGELMELQLAGKRILDCGTGTGVLAIVALLKGAAQAVAYDIDEWSVDNARHNAVLNHVDSRLTAILGDAAVIDTLDGTFDVVMANINRNILLADMPRFLRAMHAESVLLLSGFYHDDVPLLTDRAQELGLRFVYERNEDEWACLKFIRSED